MLKIGVVLPAGGVGTRFGADVPKQFLKLEDKELWRWSLEAFLRDARMTRIVLVIHPDWQEALQKELLRFYAQEWRSGRIQVALGGAERWQSTQNGVEALDSEIDFVLVHDVARPLLSQAVLDRCVESLVNHGACLVAKPVFDTVKQVSEGKVSQTLDRNEIFLAQTPQGFAMSDLKKAYEQMSITTDFCPTDEASLMERFGFVVPIVQGEELNDKVTVPQDLARLAWMRAQARTPLG